MYVRGQLGDILFSPNLMRVMYFLVKCPFVGVLLRCFLTPLLDARASKSVVMVGVSPSSRLTPSTPTSTGRAKVSGDLVA
jgi:hypothetical protein